MGDQPVARPRHVRHGNLNRRVHSRRLRAFLARMAAKLTGTGDQLTADSFYDTGVQPEQVLEPVDNAEDGQQVWVGDPSGSDYIVTPDGIFVGQVYTFVTDLDDPDNASLPGKVLIGVDAAASLQNLAYAMVADEAHAGTEFAADLTALVGCGVVHDPGVSLTVQGSSYGPYLNGVEVGSDMWTWGGDGTLDGGIYPGTLVFDSGHGFAHGAGPISIDGTSDSWTLSKTAPYWIIRLDANSLRLADSQNSAMSNLAVRLYRPTIHAEDTFKVRMAAENTTFMFEQVRVGRQSGQLEAGTDIDSVGRTA